MNTHTFFETNAFLTFRTARNRSCAVGWQCRTDFEIQGIYRGNHLNCIGWYLARILPDLMSHFRNCKQQEYIKMKRVLYYLQ